MELPTVTHVRRDAEGGITYEVLAFRALTEKEVLDSIRWYLSRTPARKRAKRGSRVTVVTLIGHNG